MAGKPTGPPGGGARVVDLAQVGKQTNMIILTNDVTLPDGSNLRILNGVAIVWMPNDLIEHIAEAVASRVIAKQLVLNKEKEGPS